MNVIVSLDEFYIEYPEFKTDAYSNIVPIAFRQTKTFIGLKNNCFLKDDKRKQAIYLLTAHLSVLSYKNQQDTLAGSNGTGGVIASASVGEVSISYQQIPTNNDSFSYWLSTTPYGLELLALLDILFGGGFYIGGSLERVF